MCDYEPNGVLFADFYLEQRQNKSQLACSYFINVPPGFNNIAS